MTPQPNPPSLLPCPFCGEHPYRINDSWPQQKQLVRHLVNDCFLSGKSIFMDVWNTRTTPPQHKWTAEELCELFFKCCKEEANGYLKHHTEENNKWQYLADAINSKNQTQ